MPYTYPYPKADITVDCVVFGVTPDWRLQVVMIWRAEDPFKGMPALPGGFIEFLEGETALEAARRELVEETGLTVTYLEQLGTFDAPNRDPRGRTFSVAHYALVRTVDHLPQGGSDASYAGWYDLSTALTMESSAVAFDHQSIIKVAHQRLRNKIRYEPIGFNLLPKEFTLNQLRQLYSAVLGTPMDKGNFGKKLRKMNEKVGLLYPVGNVREGAFGPESVLYRFNKQAYDQAAGSGSFNFDL